MNGANLMSQYVYGGVRALVELHATHLRSFVEAWKRASAAGLEMPSTDDEACATLEMLLRHVLGAARGYMVWTCGVLELDDPGIDKVPDELTDLDTYVDHLLERWDGPLTGLTQKQADRGVYPSSWGTEYCIDAMLEHAVMHPIRHERQLERLMGDN